MRGKLFQRVGSFQRTRFQVRTTFGKNIRLLVRTGKKRLILGIINFANHLYLTENLAFPLVFPFVVACTSNAGRDMSIII